MYAIGLNMFIDIQTTEKEALYNGPQQDSRRNTYRNTQCPHCTLRHHKVDHNQFHDQDHPPLFPLLFFLLSQSRKGEGENKFARPYWF